jgi:hypothetical protein
MATPDTINVGGVELVRVGTLPPALPRGPRKDSKWHGVLTQLSKDPETWYKVALSEKSNRAYTLCANLNRRARTFVADTPGEFTFKTQRMADGYAVYGCYFPSGKAKS